MLLFLIVYAKVRIIFYICNKKRKYFCFDKILTKNVWPIQKKAVLLWCEKIYKKMCSVSQQNTFQQLKNKLLNN